MQLAAIRIVADWLADDSTGYSVNTLLDTVELDDGDDKPGPVTVCDSTRHGWVARKHLSREGSGVQIPALAVFMGGDLVANGTPQTPDLRDGDIPIAIGYIEADGEHASGTAAGLYTMRAVKRSLYQLNLNENAASRTRNNVYLINWKEDRESEIAAKWNEAVVTTAIVTVWRVRDQATKPPTS